MPAPTCNPRLRPSALPVQPLPLPPHCQRQGRAPAWASAEPWAESWVPGTPRQRRERRQAS
eukprot:11719721-Alexandrium_andersonii.AAC.1